MVDSTNGPRDLPVGQGLTLYTSKLLGVSVYIHHRAPSVWEIELGGITYVNITYTEALADALSGFATSLYEAAANERIGKQATSTRTLVGPDVTSEELADTYLGKGNQNG